MKQNNINSSSNHDIKYRGMIENLVSNKNTVIEILSNKWNIEEKRILLKKIIEDYDPSSKLHMNLRDNNISSENLEHSKSLGLGSGGHHSLLFDEENSKNTNDTSANYNSFNKRPSSHSLVPNSKAISKMKQIRKSSGNNKEHNKQFINNQNISSNVTQEILESDQVISK